MNIKTSDLVTGFTFGNGLTSYTTLNQLQSASGAYGSYSYTYDLTGNRTSEVKSGGPIKLLSYPASSNRISSETTDGSLTRSFTYDGAGNTLTGLPAGSTYALTYNKRNRPQALKLNGTTVATYLYNAQEQLVSRTLSAPLTPVGVTHYIYDLDGHLIAEATGTSASTAVITREYIWLDGLPIAVIDGVNTASPITTYVHTDHLTRPIRMTDQAKATVWSASWLPYGAATNITGTLTQNQRFPGQYFLIEQGLAYNWHRFYDPTTGRYTQPDPLGFPDGPSRYAYANNSPLMYTDEDGRFIIPMIVGGLFGAGLEYFTNKCATWTDLAAAAAFGAVGGEAGYALKGIKTIGKEFSHLLPTRYFKNAPQMDQGPPWQGVRA